MVSLGTDMNALTEGTEVCLKFSGTSVAALLDSSHHHTRIRTGRIDDLPRFEAVSHFFSRQQP